ncbi:hypothetical protein FGD71_041520 [Streptomyces sporangiiformans]|uniref:Uncharacterized protein n=1 Tax=Streptomyces sporangiiformans TaxID=2315329 RepID=A0A505D169_9ACTN|nr:hypothetical protein FGD71_041520 [Streptomyces sporangiiformans]
MRTKDADQRCGPKTAAGERPLETRQRCRGVRKGVVNGGRIRPERRFPLLVRSSYGFPNLTQELAMADLAFVITTVAVFALVAFVARGVTKL